MSKHYAPDADEINRAAKRAERKAQQEAEREHQRQANGHDPRPLKSEADDDAKRLAQADYDPQSLRNNGSSIAAVMDILRNFPTWCGVLAFDRFALRVMLMKSMPRTGRQALSDQWVPKIMRDVDCTNALAWFHDLGMTKLTINMLHNAMAAVAQDNAFHPVLDYFDRICSGPDPAMPASANGHMINPTLEKADALSLWLTLGFGAADNKLNRAIARAFMIAVARRVRQPGSQQDYMPVLFGGQGDMKSTGARILFSDTWFADRLPAINNKDALIQLHGKLVIERPELENLGSADKAFISSSSDRFRAPYGRIAEDHPRTCNFFGTTNFSDFIKDASGGRRYWPVPIVAAGDRNWLATARDLIWRQACIAEAKGETAWLNTKELQRLVRLRQDAAQQPDPWDDKVVEEALLRAAAWVKNPNVTPGVKVNADFITAAVDLPKDRQNNGHLQRATNALMKADWRRGTGRRRKLWFSPEFQTNLPFEGEDDDDG
jgi:predicted P-loop ATPase